MMSDHIPLDAPAVAREFLNQWERACTPRDGVDPASFLGRDFQSGLAKKFALFTGHPISMGEADEVACELRRQRVARGWPDIKPTIEATLMMFWLSGLRAAERADQKEDESDPNQFDDCA
jgi:hypothetical protein